MDTVFLCVNTLSEDGVDGMREQYFNLHNIVNMSIHPRTGHMWITDVNRRSFEIDDESRDIILRQLQGNMC